jgi:hypothetical protein
MEHNDAIYVGHMLDMTRRAVLLMKPAVFYELSFGIFLTL